MKGSRKEKEVTTEPNSTSKLNEARPASDVEGFYKEAERRGVYTAAQDSLISTWRTLASTVLPGVGVDLSSITVGELKGKLPDLLKTHGAKTDVKATTIQTYQIKGLRMLSDFIEHNGSTDTEWFDWKAKNERKSANASAAASSRHAAKRATVQRNEVTDAAESSSLKSHPLKLPEQRHAELHVPDDLTEADLVAMEKGFGALLGYLRSQILD